MTPWRKLLAGAALALLAFTLAAGCAEREHRTMTVHEEQQEGEVQESRPGEMVVE